MLELFKPEHMCAVLDEAYSRLLGLPAPAADDLDRDERSPTIGTFDLAALAVDPQSSQPERVLRARTVGRRRSRRENGTG